MAVSKKIVLTTMPLEGEFINWCTPNYYLPSPKKLNYMPLGILSLATNLGEENEVVILDPPSKGWDIEETVSKIEDKKPDILGLSVVTQRAYAMAKILELTTAPYKAVGGPHATHYAEQILASGADSVFVGQLADNEFREAVYSMPKGIIYCKTAINNIKFPKREFVDIKDYFPKSSVLFKAENRLPIFTSVGCSYSCVFCDVQTKKPHRKSPETIVDEMQYLYSIECRSIHVLDDNFNFYERHVNEIIDEMDRRNLSVEWSGRGRARMSKKLIERLTDHDFKRIHVGIEALSDDILRFFRKRIKTENIFKFCEDINKSGIDLLAYFILGTPVETEQYLQWLPQKIRELGIKYPYFNILFPAPNTEYYMQLLKDGVYSKDYWAEYFENPTADFQIPFPYGEKKYNAIAVYVKGLIEEFESKD